MNKKNDSKILNVKLPTRPMTLEFPIVRIGIKKSIAGMWPNGK